MENLNSRISQLDASLFDAIESQTTANDRKSLLALHDATAQRLNDFCWLEIGSHLGGSLQVAVVDPRCTQVISIDPRPISVRDERGPSWRYEGNSTQRMLTLLGQIPGAQMDKIQTLDASTDTLEPSAITRRPDVCFIDAEHTDEAVVRDARFCLRVMSPDGCIAFHDGQIIYRGLLAFVRELEQSGREFRAFNLPDCMFVIELGNFRLSSAPQIRSMLDNNHVGYLWCLNVNDEYRQTCRRRSFRALSRFLGIVHRVTRRNARK